MTKELACQATENLEVTCSIADPTGGPTQNMLELLGGQFAIDDTLSNGGNPSTFTLIPVI